MSNKPSNGIFKLALSVPLAIGRYGFHEINMGTAKPLVHQLVTLPQIKLNLIYCSGQLSGADLEGTLDLFGYNASFDDLIVYAADASLAGIDFNSAREQASRLVQDAQQSKDGKRRALVTANAMQGVLGRMFLGFVRSIAPINFEIECFDNLGTALAWISASRTSGPKIDRSIVLRTLADLERRTGTYDPGAASTG